MKYLIMFLSLVLWCEIAYADELCVKDKVCYDVKVAKTDEERMKGLMFVKEMPKNEGMLFDFSMYDSKNIAMWMKNTYIPLDMLFIGCNGSIVDFVENTVPFSLDTIKSDKDFCFVLEVNGGEVKSRGLKIGDKFDGIKIDFMTRVIDWLYNLM